ncbi:magnesium transporter CorA [Desulfosarcina widdelii]|uniref:Magnesium transporter CorA n=1 Tax=Desulfosarcina widdelii TaxID=947919 RepID=A0A5K7YYP3_9BACT|nr:magnesium transporter CorA family protein [Desulfosarcina widdelii]BBO73500.1 magnesium transporter CorA [Desulfosarcina widdelii]
MIKILRWAENRFVQADQIERHCLINVVNPGKEELEKLTVEMRIPSDFLTDPMDIDERSRIETENGFLLIVLRLPKYNEGSDVPFTTFPAGIVLTKDDTIVFVSSSDIMDILNLSDNRLKGVADGKRSSVILHIFLKTALLYLRYLKEINRKYGEIEHELQKSLKNKELIKLLNIEKSLVFFMTSLKSNELMMERLMKTELLKLTADDKDRLEDVLIENRQAIETANIYSNILSGMMDAFASVISNNLNVVMKILTSITVILMIPTLAASIYGMNIELPFQHLPHAFYIITGTSFCALLLCAVIFKINKWF